MMLLRKTACWMLVLFMAAIPPAAAEAVHDRLLTRYDYPFEVETHTFRSQGQMLEMKYMDLRPAPDAANGKTALLLHGKNFTGAYWKNTAETLLKRGYRVVIPDQIGFGKSAKPAAYQFSLHALAENTRGLLDSLGVDHATVIGHSMGGMLAVRFALLYPMRVERLVLVSPLGLEDWQKIVPNPGIDKWLEKEKSQTPETVIEYQKKNYYHGNWTPEAAAAAEPLLGWLRGADVGEITWIAALTDDMLFTQPVIYEIGGLKMPTLIIVGEFDRTALGKDFIPEEVAQKMGHYPDLASQAARSIPRSKVAVIRESGHLPHIDQPEKFEKALFEFIDKKTFLKSKHERTIQRVPKEK